MIPTPPTASRPLPPGFARPRASGALWLIAAMVGSMAGFSNAPASAASLDHRLDQSSPDASPYQPQAPTLTGGPSVRVYEGFVEAIQSVVLSSGENGQIVDLPVQVGDRVARGDLICQFNDAAEAAAVRLAQAQAEAVGEVEAARATMTLQQIKLETLEQLAAKSLADPMEVRRAEAEWRIADARYRGELEQKRIRTAELKRAIVMSDRRRVRAPFDAVVARVDRVAGESVLPGQSSLVQLIRTDALVARLNVPADEIHLLRIGQSGEVQLHWVGASTRGRILRISPLIDSESGTVEVHVRIDNPDGLLRPGDRCTCRLVVRPGSPSHQPTPLDLGWSVHPKFFLTGLDHGEGRLR